LWDAKKGGNISVIVSVDGGGLSAFKPLAGDFIRAGPHSVSLGVRDRKQSKDFIRLGRIKEHSGVAEPHYFSLSGLADFWATSCLAGLSECGKSKMSLSSRPSQVLPEV